MKKTIELCCWSNKARARTFQDGRRVWIEIDRWESRQTEMSDPSDCSGRLPVSLIRFFWADEKQRVLFSVEGADVLWDVSTKLKVSGGIWASSMWCVLLCLHLKPFTWVNLNDLVFAVKSSKSFREGLSSGTVLCLLTVGILSFSRINFYFLGFHHMWEKRWCYLFTGLPNC